MCKHTDFEFWHAQANFPLNNQDLLYLKKTLRELSSDPKDTGSVELWASFIIAKIDAYFRIYAPKDILPRIDAF